MNNVIVVGAGLSGLVAAINLRRSGHEVLVIEKEKNIGGPFYLHPSVHTTPIYPRILSAKVGIPLDKVFIPLDSLHVAIRSKLYTVNPSGLHAVERGGRKSSIDNFLFDIAKSEGVKFNFGHEIKKLEDIPKRSVIATGFQPGLIKKLGMNPLPTFGFSTTRKIKDDKKAKAVIYFDSKITPDYFYSSSVNGLLYGLIFFRNSKGDRKTLPKLMELYKKREGVELDDWYEVRGDIPWTPRLFADDYILAGTSAGAMDPIMAFGIHGAIISGKIAAMAADDPEGAEKEFKNITRYLFPAYLMWKFYEFLPLRDFLWTMTIPWIEMFLFMSWIPERGVPGIKPGWSAPIARSLKQVKSESFK